jgi:hypothetical protein
MSWLFSWFAGYVMPALVAVLTPIVIAAIKWLIAEFEMTVPKAMLPTIAPIVGAILEAALGMVSQAAGIPGLPPGISGALLGAVGNWLRELVDQWKKHFQSETPATVSGI